MCDDSNKWNRITGISAMITATCALFVSVWQGYETRTHNRLTVRPHLQLTRSIERGKPIGLYVKNVGSGPAIIKKVEVYFADNLIKEGPDNFAPRQIMKLIQPKHGHWFFCNLTPEYRLMPGEEVVYVGATLRDASKEEKETLFKNMHKVTLFLEYESIYGEKFGPPEEK